MVDWLLDLPGGLGLTPKELLASKTPEIVVGKRVTHPISVLSSGKLLGSIAIG